MFSRLLLFTILVWSSCGVPKSADTADLILFNGNIFTADSALSNATAIAIHGDKILAVGNDADIKKLAAEKTQMLDLKGQFVMPGFIEGHGHFNGLGKSLQNLNLMPTTSWSEIVGLVAEKAKTAPAGQWIEGRGWHQEKWTSTPVGAVNGYPRHDDLSAVSAEHPVVLYHASGHGLMANQKAMQLAGVSRETPDPPGGRIVRDAHGLPIGVFEENAMELIEKPFSAWKNQRPESERVADFDKTTAAAVQECLRRGITSFQDAGSDFWELAQYRRLAESGQLSLRLWAMISQPKPEDLGRLADYPQIGLGNGHFTSRAVKAYFDGALGSYGAWLLSEYTDKPGFFGQNTMSTESIKSVAEACRDRGLQLCVHAIGDRANREILNIYEATMPSGTTNRWRIEHAQHIDPQDIPRFSKLGVTASMQAIHCTSDAPFVPKRLGYERARTGAYAWRSLLDSGAHLANGTDAPVEDVNPLPCLYASITRQSPTGDTNSPAFFPEQCMTRQEALLSYTRWNAWAAFEEKEKGALETGKWADLIVLDTDLLRCAPMDVLKAKVLKTMVGGKWVYEVK